MARKVAKKANKKAATKKVPAKKPPSPPKAAKVRTPTNAAKWTAFLNEHPTVYTACFASTINTPTGKGLTSVVRAAIAKVASGPWETTTLQQGTAKLVVAAFAEKADFAAAKKQFKGKPWKSIVKGSVDGFSVS